MKEKSMQSSSHAEHVARRAFIKQAALGAVFAVPAIETFTKSDILMKSALAATVPLWTITAEVFSGPGTVSPPSQKVADGGSAIVTLTLTSMMAVWSAYSLDHGMTWTNTNTLEQQEMTYTFTNVHGNIDFEVRFDVM